MKIIRNTAFIFTLLAILLLFSPVTILAESRTPLATAENYAPLLGTKWSLTFTINEKLYTDTITCASSAFESQGNFFLDCTSSLYNPSAGVASFSSTTSTYGLFFSFSLSGINYWAYYSMSVSTNTASGSHAWLYSNYTYATTTFPTAGTKTQSPLNAKFIADPLTGGGPLTVNFINQSEGSANFWAWDFGDGSTSRDKNPSHTYATSGNYTVILTISDGAGSDTETKTNYITVTGDPGPAVQEDYRFERMWPTLQQPWYFNSARSIAMDRGRNIYVVDAWKYQVVKFSANGHFITKWGGKGTGNGQFMEPVGINVDGNDNVYVSDKTLNRIQKFTADGEFIKAWGSPDGNPGSENGQFNKPVGIFIFDEDHLYVVDEQNHRIQKFTMEGVHVSSFGSNGSGAGQFNKPGGVAMDSQGNFYVSDQLNNRVQKFSADWQYLTEWGSQGSGQGQLDTPVGLFIDASDNVYVAEYGNNRIQIFSAEPGGGYRSTVIWGEYGLGNGQFWRPLGIVQDKDGNLFTTELLGGRIQKFTSQREFITSWKCWSYDQGMFHNPYGVAVDNAGNVYVADTDNNRIQKFSPDGRFITAWGSPGGNKSSVNGEFNTPWGVAVDGQGANVYVADTENNRIQQFAARTDGSGGYAYVRQWGGFGSGVGIFNNPRGVATIRVDTQGNLFVADTFNHKIKKFTADGVLLTEWGSRSSSTPGEDGTFRYPHGLGVDSAGNVYVADTFNDRIQKFIPVPDGSGGYTYVFHLKWGAKGSGEGEFDRPYRVNVDSKGNVYVADPYNNRIQKFTASGKFITRIGAKGANPGQVDFPTDVALGANGNVYIADYFNSRVQVLKKVALGSNSKAIIVAGGGNYPGNDLWNATQMSANFAYRTLTYQGFNKESIHYLTSNTKLDLDDNGVADDVAGDATSANLQKAIANWAANADSLIIYLVDHGGVDSFRMSGSETLSAATLASWLNQFQGLHNIPVTIIYDACESGSFVEDLKPPAGKERIAITSTSPGESAYFVTQGSVSFSNYFWTHVFNGVNIKDAFELTKEAIKYTTPYQNPLLDANGNGVANEAEDLTILQNAYIGNGTLIQGNAPVIASVSPAQMLTDTNTALLSADGVTDADGIARVWAVLRPPDYNQDNSGGPVQNLPSVDLMPKTNDRYEATYTGFTTSGTYQIAIYARDRIGNTSVPKVTTVSVNNPLSRRAIIIAGGSQNDALWPAIQKGATLAYNALIFQGYRDDDIYFMSPVTFSAGIDGTATLNNLNHAITSWAANNTQDLVLYLIGSGEEGKFQIGAAETLDASDLKTWLNTLQNKMAGDVTVVYDAPRSGSFIAVLAPPPQGRQRIVLTSAGRDQSANYLSSGDVSFSKFFWSRVSNGTDIRGAFLHAKNAMSFSTNSRQVAVMDDNGNGVGNEKSDGTVAMNTSIGFGISLAADDPLIGSVAPEQILNDGTTSALIWAKDVTTTGTIDRVWAVITPPSFTGSSSGAVIDLPSVTLSYNQTADRYEGTYSNFTAYGEYGIAVYAMDTDKNISLPSTTKATQNLGPDKYEADDAFQQAKVIMLNDQDPNTSVEGYEKFQTHTFHKAGDEDWVMFPAIAGQTYKLSVNAPGPKSDPSIRIYGTDGATPMTAEVDDYGPGEAEYVEWMCPADGVYYARVKQGAGSENVYGAGAQYQLTLTIPTAAFNGFIYGQITPVVALATVSTGYGSALTLPNGYFFMPHIAGTFTLTVNVPGYVPYSGAVTVGELKMATVNIALSSASQPPSPPTLDAVTSPTGVSQQTIKGTKDANTSVLLNGIEIVPRDQLTVWTYNLTLTEGGNPISLTSKNEAGLASAATTGTIVLDTTIPVTIANPVGGLYNSAQTVSLTVSEVAVIYYTVDGTNPTESSSQYTSPIRVNATTTLKYFARDRAGNVEPVKESNYTIIIDIPGDVDGDGAVTIADAIIVLQAMAGMHPQGLRSDYLTSRADVNKDGRLALHEVVYILQSLAGMR